MLSSTAASELPWEELSSWGCFWDWGKQHTSSAQSCRRVLLFPTITALHTLRLELAGGLLSPPDVCFAVRSGFYFLCGCTVARKLVSSSRLSHWCPRCSPDIDCKHCSAPMASLKKGEVCTPFSWAPLPNEPFLLILWVPRAGWKHQDTHWREEKQ